MHNHIDFQSLYIFLHLYALFILYLFGYYSILFLQD
nr:MAG TPA: hypothetical protein [Caudoviricetes sp.]